MKQCRGDLPFNPEGLKTPRAKFDCVGPGLAASPMRQHIANAKRYGQHLKLRHRHQKDWHTAITPKTKTQASRLRARRWKHNMVVRHSTKATSPQPICHSMPSSRGLLASKPRICCICCSNNDCIVWFWFSICPCNCWACAAT